MINAIGTGIEIGIEIKTCSVFDGNDSEAVLTALAFVLNTLRSASPALDDVDPTNGRAFLEKGGKTHRMHRTRLDGSE